MATPISPIEFTFPNYQILVFLNYELTDAEIAFFKCSIYEAYLEVADTADLVDLDFIRSCVSACIEDFRYCPAAFHVYDSQGVGIGLQLVYTATQDFFEMETFGEDSEC